MSDAKHTAGPWRLVEDSGSCLIMDDGTEVCGGFQVEAASSDAYLAVATAHGIGDMDPELSEIGEAECMANARLIAAAPDLLERAKALTDRDCRYERGNIVIPCGGHAEALVLLASLRAAISRTEGR